MIDHRNQPQGRREFFRSIGRNLAFGAIAAVSAALSVRSRSSDRREKCINQGICRGCPALDDCRLPQALSARRAGMKG